MTKVEFVDKVKLLLTTDWPRAGATAFAEALIEQGMLDLQSHIEAYRKGHTEIYLPEDFTTDSFVSTGDLPPEAMVREAYLLRSKSKAITGVDTAADQLTVVGHSLSTAETEPAVVTGSISNSGGEVPQGTTAGRAYFLRPVGLDGVTLHTTAEGAVESLNKVDLTGAGSGTNTLHYNRTRHGLDQVGWDSRHYLSAGQVCMGDYIGRIAIDPHGTTFYVYPEIKAVDDSGFSYQVEIVWDGKKLDWAPGDTVPFLQSDALVVCDFVKARMERQVKRDLAMAGSYAGTHQVGKRTSYLDAQQRGRSRH